MTESFGDRLAALNAERAALDEQADRARGQKRREEYLAGKSVAADIIGRVAAFGSTYDRNEQTLREAARQQPQSLLGRIAAAGLSEAASDIAPHAAADRERRARAVQREAGEADRLARYHDCAAQRDQDWYIDRRR